MQQEAPNELLGRQRHFTFLTAVSVIFPAEGDFTILQGDEPVIGDGHAMGVTRQIMQHMLGAAKRLSHIDHPFVLVECVQESSERASFSQPGQRAVEAEFLTAEEAFQRVRELSPEHFAEYRVGQEEPGALGPHPLGASGGEAPCRHHAMNVRMVESTLTIP